MYRSPKQPAMRKNMKTTARILAALLLSLTFVQAVSAQTHRSEAAKNAFKAAHPCPANGARSGPCPGYVIDHIRALACGGPDDPSNMQWQSVEEGKAKDKWERKGCETGAQSEQPPIINAPEAVGSGKYQCGAKSTCKQMSSCEEAKFYLNTCGLRRLDRDGDGVPCEAVC